MGLQSLVLKWENYQYTTYNGYNYIRIRGSFIKTENEKFLTLLVQSDDQRIGVIISLPSICLT